MMIVGNHLANVAGKSSDKNEINLFGRSAFNRYYYAAFLSIRNVLKSIEPSWATPTHQDIPVLLLGKVLTRIRNQTKTAEKTHQITSYEGKKLIHLATAAASDLSNLLKSAREVRRLADYEPETLVVRTGSEMTLGQSTLVAAQKWQARVDAHGKTILKVYDDLGLI